MSDTALGCGAWSLSACLLDCSPTNAGSPATSPQVSAEHTEMWSVGRPAARPAALSAEDEAVVCHIVTRVDCEIERDFQREFGRRKNIRDLSRSPELSCLASVVASSVVCPHLPRDPFLRSVFPVSHPRDRNGPAASPAHRSGAGRRPRSPSREAHLAPPLLSLLSPGWGWGSLGTPGHTVGRSLSWLSGGPMKSHYLFFRWNTCHFSLEVWKRSRNRRARTLQGAEKGQGRAVSSRSCPPGPRRSLGCVASRCGPSQGASLAGGTA